ncbi:DUF938 domain-containing protein [Aliidiomarina soli]|uniref:Methylase n=1 Tax=Aliidiomarina soli TaxID=1928574 RepID=A0A432WHX4_9GAMM|nr:DUF938 domain-containing protein [Aliidiomarina soli]RUO33355.1 methylase [Aliidiomarina soli]
MSLPFSQACENNKRPIFEILSKALSEPGSVLEVGSGSGQHAEFFAQQLPHIRWQCSDVEANLPGLQARIREAQLENLPAALAFDVNRQQIISGRFDLVYSANTLHIMSWPTVVRFFKTLPALLNEHGSVWIYGPFNYGGLYTSGSNELFDQSLKSRNAGMGIRDIEKVQQLAHSQGFTHLQDYQMPANNRLLRFYKG